MRIVQVTPYLDGIGGIEVYVGQLSRSLREQGAIVHLAVPVPDWEADEETDWEGFPVFRYGMGAALSAAQVQGLEAAPGAARLRDWLRRVRPEIVHFHGLGPGMGVEDLEAARATGARTVLTLHLPSLGWNCLRGSMMREGSRPCDGKVEAVKCAACVYQMKGIPAEVSRWAAAGFARGGMWAAMLPGALGRMGRLPGVVRGRMRRQREALESCDAVVAVAEWARQVLLLNGARAERVEMIPNGVAPGVAAGGAGRREKTAGDGVRIGFIGRLDPDKGALLLLRAWRRLPRGLKAELEICGAGGNGEWRGEMERLRALAEGDGRVRLRTDLTREQVAEALRDYDVLCCPSRLFELGPMVILEAWAAGVPAIGSEVPNISQLIQDGVNGRLFPAGDEAALARLLEEMARFPEKTVEVWRRGLGPVRTMEEVAAANLSLYKRLREVEREGDAVWDAAGG